MVQSVKYQSHKREDFSSIPRPHIPALSLGAEGWQGRQRWERTHWPAGLDEFVSSRPSRDQTSENNMRGKPDGSASKGACHGA